jgi:hypothetical protein
MTKLLVEIDKTKEEIETRVIVRGHKITIFDGMLDYFIEITGKDPDSYGVCSINILKEYAEVIAKALLEIVNEKDTQENMAVYVEKLRKEGYNRPENV